jgi:lysophospholipid acyltransferase (LPLAT)-like uncharacterized protein
VQVVLTPAIVNYIKLVINSSTIVADPPDFIGRARELHPSIIALWHGQFFLLAWHLSAGHSGSRHRFPA